MEFFVVLGLILIAAAGIYVISGNAGENKLEGVVDATKRGLDKVKGLAISVKKKFEKKAK